MEEACVKYPSPFECRYLMVVVVEENQWRRVGNRSRGVRPGGECSSFKSVSPAISAAARVAT